MAIVSKKKLQKTTQEIVETKSTEPKAEETVIKKVDFCKILIDNLRERAEPSESAKIVGFCYKNEIYTVIDENNEWIKLDGNFWVMKKFTEKVRNDI